LDQAQCNCDCGCKKPNDRPDEQCDDCDNGIHWDWIHSRYVNYNLEDTKKLEITLFKSGVDVRQGDKFVAVIDTVEGHRRVILRRFN